MNIARSSSQIPVELGSTSSIREQVLSGLSVSREYREAFIEESLRTRITAQIRALRDSRGLDYKAFADRIDKRVSWAYRLEDPNAAPPTIPTLLQVGAAFDICLDVRFRPFSELLDDVVSLGPESFTVPSFEDELRLGLFSRTKCHGHASRTKRHRPRSSRGDRNGTKASDSIGASKGTLGAVRGAGQPTMRAA
jgi:hypothetical protein